jgi:hypothetical protein
VEIRRLIPAPEGYYSLDDLCRDKLQVSYLGEES